MLLWEPTLASAVCPVHPAGPQRPGVCSRVDQWGEREGVRLQRGADFRSLTTCLGQKKICKGRKSNSTTMDVVANQERF